jgi:hypothetical protein
MDSAVRSTTQESNMNRFAIIESNTGYVWGVVNAESALAACAACDADAGGDRGEGYYEEVSESELRTSRGVYDVRTAPEGFSVTDGQADDDIERVSALPRAGVFGWVPAE